MFHKRPAESHTAGEASFTHESLWRAHQKPLACDPSNIAQSQAVRITAGPDSAGKQARAQYFVTSSLISTPRGAGEKQKENTPEKLD